MPIEEKEVEVIVERLRGLCILCIMHVKIKAVFICSSFIERGTRHRTRNS